MYEQLAERLLQENPELKRKMLEEQQKQLQEEQENKKKSPYKDFAQLNRNNLDHLIYAVLKDSTAVAILLFFMKHMDRMNALVCSYKVLEEQLGLSRTTLSNSIKYLKEKGFIYVYKSGTSNVYVINDDLAWTSYGDRTQYCKFPATVMLSAAEQDEIQQKKVKFTMTKQLDEKKKK